MNSINPKTLNDGVYLWNRGGKFAKIKREGDFITLIDKNSKIVDTGEIEEIEKRGWSLYYYE